MWAKNREIAMTYMTGHQTINTLGAGSANLLLVRVAAHNGMIAALPMGGGKNAVSCRHSITSRTYAAQPLHAAVAHIHSAHEGAPRSPMG